MSEATLPELYLHTPVGNPTALVLSGKRVGVGLRFSGMLREFVLSYKYKRLRNAVKIWNVELKHRIMQWIDAGQILFENDIWGTPDDDFNSPYATYNEIGETTWVQ